MTDTNERAQPSAEDQGRRAEPRTRVAEVTRWDRYKANAKTIGGAVILAIFIRIVLFEAFEIEGPSMQPTLLSGDRVVVAKFMYGLFLPFTSEAVMTWGMPDAGDVVIVKSPADDIDIVKRVIGLPGDTLELRDNVVWRNGEPLTTAIVGDCEPGGYERYFAGGCIVVRETLEGVSYLTSRSPEAHGRDSPTVVPPGHIYILGDHRDRSNDSRNLGPIAIDRVKGQALLIYWSSFRKFGDEFLPTVRWGRIGEGVD